MDMYTIFTLSISPHSLARSCPRTQFCVVSVHRVQQLACWERSAGKLSYSIYPHPETNCSTAPKPNPLLAITLVLVSTLFFALTRAPSPQVYGVACRRPQRAAGTHARVEPGP